MKTQIRIPNRPTSSRLHPAIYLTIVGLICWLISAIWGFVGPGFTGMALSVISLFIGAATLLQVILWRISRRDPARRRSPDEPSALADWLSHDFVAWTGRMTGADAALEILLPVMAAAFGMSALAVILHLSVAF